MPHFFCLNFANTDMEATDIFAAMKAAETVDQCMSEIIPLALEHASKIRTIIADHGNSDQHDQSRWYTEYSAYQKPGPLHYCQH